MKVRRFFFSPVVLFAAALLLIPNSSAFAHGSTTVGDYTVEIGFKNEPALQGEINGLDLVVTNSKTNKPVTGLEDTLQAEIIFGASKKALKIEPVEGEDGAYTADVLPTALGDYTWHIFGKIENTPVDVKMTSSPTTFVSVVPPSDVSFPGQQPAVLDVEARLAQAEQRATMGIIVGAAGLLVGIVSLAIAFSRRPANR
jgi:hypothetical protein